MDINYYEEEVYPQVARRDQEYKTFQEIEEEFAD
jgi:hypothetical protein